MFHRIIMFHGHFCSEIMGLAPFGCQLFVSRSAWLRQLENETQSERLDATTSAWLRQLETAMSWLLTAMSETQSERLAATTRFKSNFAATRTVAYKAKECGPPTNY